MDKIKQSEDTLDKKNSLRSHLDKWPYFSGSNLDFCPSEIEKLEIRKLNYYMVGPWLWSELVWSWSSSGMLLLYANNTPMYGPEPDNKYDPDLACWRTLIRHQLTKDSRSSCIFYDSNHTPVNKETNEAKMKWASITWLSIVPNH